PRRGATYVLRLPVSDDTSADERGGRGERRDPEQRERDDQRARQGVATEATGHPRIRRDGAAVEAHRAGALDRGLVDGGVILRRRRADDAVLRGLRRLVEVAGAARVRAAAAGAARAPAAAGAVRVAAAARVGRVR